jgi:TolB-like protein
LLLTTLLLAMSPPARAVERLAVLEISGDLSVKERGFLTDALRGEIVKAVQGRVQVMTRENMEVMLTDMGLDANCISEGACEVETARNLGVDYVASGTLTTFGTTTVMSLKLHETGSGQLLAVEEGRGTDILSLRDGLSGPGRALVASLAGAPVATPPTASTPDRLGVGSGAPQTPVATRRPAKPYTGELVALGSGYQMVRVVPPSGIDYWVGKTEVTQGLYEGIMRTGHRKAILRVRIVRSLSMRTARCGGAGCRWV